MSSFLSKIDAKAERNLNTRGNLKILDRKILFFFVKFSYFLQNYCVYICVYFVSNIYNMSGRVVSDIQ